MPTLYSTPKPLKWAPLGRKIIAKQEAAEERHRKRPCYRKFEYESLPGYEKLRNSGRMRLESFEKAMRFYFEHSTMKLGYMQKKLIDVFTIASLRKFFKNDLVANLRYLGKKYLIDALNDAVAILYPRRSGKTEGSAFYIAVTTVSQPDWNSIMFNLTNRQAKEFLQTTIKHLEVFRDDEEFGWTVVQQDLRQYIRIRTKKYGTVNSIKSFPCALKASDANIRSTGRISVPPTVEQAAATTTLCTLTHINTVYSSLHWTNSIGRWPNPLE